MNSINKEIWKSFLFFTLINISVLVILQVVFLNFYYKYSIKNDIKQITNKIKKNHNLKENTKKTSYGEGICIDITDSNGNILYNSISNNKICSRNKKLISKYQQSFIKNNNNDNIYEINDKKNKTEFFLSGTKLNENKYAFVYTPIFPNNKTMRILQSQLISIAILLLILSSILSYLLSKKLSKPIINISNDAKELAKGNYIKEINTNSNIKEINTLTNTLNSTRIELAKTEELRRDLMANVSHDMKTPLTMIKAYTEMMLDIHKNSIKKRNEDGKIIIEEVNRLNILVNDILELSKIQSNLDELHKENIELVSLINIILTKFKYLEEENYIFIFNHNVDELIINVDKKKLEQVIYNLINNAVNYVGDDKKVIIDLIVDDEIILKVTDHGKGIKKEEINHIWDKYYKNSKQHKRNKSGTGLGLAIVKNALENHNYEYGVDSIEGKGSTFWFKLKK